MKENINIEIEQDNVKKQKQNSEKKQKNEQVKKIEIKEVEKKIEDTVNKEVEKKIEDVVNKIEKTLFEPSNTKEKVVNITIKKPQKQKIISKFTTSINIPLMSKLRGTRTRKTDKIITKFIIGAR